MADLESIKQMAKKAALVLIVLAGFAVVSTPQTGYAQNSSNGLPLETLTIDAADLQKNIDEVMTRREFAWRMPRPEVAKETREDGFIIKALKWVSSLIKDNADAIASWMARFFEWLAKLFPDDFNIDTPQEPKSHMDPRYLTAGLISLLIGLLGFIAWHIRKIKLKKKEEPEQIRESIPDVADENVLADSLPSEKWISLAFELMEKGQMRTAIRALYLGTLALLSQKKLILIARHKSNREYQLELIRRSHSKQKMHDDFIQTVQIVDRVWYGMHEIDKDGFDQFVKTQKRIFQYAG